MKIPICYIPKTRFKKYLYIEKKYISEAPIIPLGFNCHPAYMLKQLHLRTLSFPFDWLCVDPNKGLTYVCDNIENNFASFLSNLQKNDEGYIYSKNHPYAFFYHEKELIESEYDRDKLNRRAKRFLDFLNNRTVRFLYMTPSIIFRNQSAVEKLYDSVIRFTRLMKESDRLYIYINHEETLDENRIHIDKFIQMVRKLNSTYITKYLKQSNQYGLWGDTKKYPDLLKELRLPIQRTRWPKVFLG